jgi:hypothetical protein
MIESFVIALAGTDMSAKKYTRMDIILTTTCPIRGPIKGPSRA